MLIFLFTKSFSSLRHITLSSLLCYYFSPILSSYSISSNQTFYLSSITSHQSYLSLIFLSTDPLSLLFSFSPIISCALFPGSPILSFAAIASHSSFLLLLFLLTNPFSISHPSHQSFLSILYFHQCSCISNSSYLSIFGCSM